MDVSESGTQSDWLPIKLALPRIIQKDTCDAKEGAVHAVPQKSRPEDLRNPDTSSLTCCQLIDALNCRPTASDTEAYIGALNSLFTNAINIRNLSSMTCPWIHTTPDFRAELPLSQSHSRTVNVNELLQIWTDFTTEFPHCHCMPKDIKVELDPKRRFAEVYVNTTTTGVRTAGPMKSVSKSLFRKHEGDWCLAQYVAIQGIDGGEDGV